MGVHWQMNKRGRTKKPPHKKDQRPALERRVFRYYEANSKRRGIKFKITFEEFKTYIHKNCFYCGAPPSNKMNPSYGYGRVCRSTLMYSGVDRKDNSKGYTLDNVVPCCKRCNRIKSDLFTYEEMLKLSEFLKGLPKAPQQEAQETEAQLATILRQRIESLKKSS